MITGEVEAVDRKQKIRDRYKGVDISELEVIPAKIIELSLIHISEPTRP